MSRTVDYFFAPPSPWAYLGHGRFVDMCERHGATVRVKPVDIGRIFALSGGLPLAQRPPQRQAYRLVELRRWSERLGVPLNLHPKGFPVAGNDASLRIVAADLCEGTDAALRYTGALMRAVWAEERSIADAATLDAIARDCGLDTEALAARAADAATRFEAYTQEAIEGQVFGAPWYVVDGEPFWGQDRLDFVDAALARGIDG